MTIPMLQGWDAGFEKLPEIAKNINNIVNPDNELQQALKRAVAASPQLAQQLANLEAQNPGFISNTFGQSKITDNLSGLRPDFQTQAQMQIAPAALQQLQDPTVLAEAGSGMLGVQTPTKRVAEQLSIKGQELANQGRETENQINLAQLSELNNTITAHAQALQQIPSLKGVDIGKLAQQVYSGKGIDNTLMNRIHADPGAMIQFKSLLDAFQQKGEFANRLKLTQLGKSEELQAANLLYLDKYIDNLQGRLNNAEKITKAIEPGKLIMMRGQAKKNPDGPEAVQLKQLEEAQAALPTLKSDLNEALTRYNDVYKIRFGGPSPRGGNPTKGGDTGAKEVPVNEVVDQNVVMQHKGKITKAQADEALAANRINKATYNALLSSASPTTSSTNPTNNSQSIIQVLGNSILNSPGGNMLGKIANTRIGDSANAIDLLGGLFK